MLQHWAIVFDHIDFKGVHYIMSTPSYSLKITTDKNITGACLTFFYLEYFWGHFWPRLVGDRVRKNSKQKERRTTTRRRMKQNFLAGIKLQMLSLHAL